MSNDTQTQATMPHPVKWAKDTLMTLGRKWGPNSNTEGLALELVRESNNFLTREDAFNLVSELRQWYPDGPDPRETAERIWLEHVDRTEHGRAADDKDCAACQMAGALGFIDPAWEDM